MAAILVVLFCSIMGLSTPFEPVHLLFINLLTDSLPALAIGMEPSDKQLLNNKPRNPKVGIVTKEFSIKVLGYGILIAIVTLIAYFLGMEEGASTMAFATLTLARLFHGFTCRSSLSICRIKLMSNKWSIAAFAVGSVLLGVVLFVPFMQGLFMVVPLAISQIIWSVCLAFVPTLVIQTSKMLKEYLIGISIRRV